MIKLKKKKSIVFLADSSLILLNLYYQLKKKFNIIWIIYHKSLYEDLKRRKIGNLYLTNLSISFLVKKNIISKLLRFLIYEILKVKVKHFDLDKKVKNIEKIYEPAFWLTDTATLLAETKTRSPKGTTHHSVCYKRAFNDVVIKNYDYVFLPGQYQKQRTKKFFKESLEKTSLKVVGNVKLINFIKNKKIDIRKKKKFFKKNKLDVNKKTVLFAVTHDAFPNKRFFPIHFGNQFEALNTLSKKVNGMGYNFIIKFHHFSYYFHKNKIIKKISKERLNYVFNSKKYYDTSESDDIFRIADIVITDISGVGPIGIYLDKKIIFLEPDLSLWNWDKADISKNLRPGYICKEFNEITRSIIKYKNNDPFVQKRRNFVNKIFYQPNKNAIYNLSKCIRNILK